MFKGNKKALRTTPHGGEWNTGNISEFHIFFNLFHETLGVWNNSKIWETRRTFANIARGKRVITNSSLNAFWNQMYEELFYLFPYSVELV